jgi:NADPH:quinone reductase-like Zn-dependent oxidoreductase
MRAIIATDRSAGPAGLTLAEVPEPNSAADTEWIDYGDVIVEVHASGFTATELEWGSTWVDRLGRDRTPTIPGHEVAGVVTALGYGTTGLTVGQRVFGLTEWTRDGTLAEYVAVEARNLAPLPGDVDVVDGASLVMPGLTGWQGLFDHGHLVAGQSVLVNGAAGAVGSIVTQLARDAGAHVIGTGRAAHRETALEFGAHEFLDLGGESFADVGGVDLVFDLLGGELGRRSMDAVRTGGSFVTVAGMPQEQLPGIRSVGFIVVSDRAQLERIAQLLREGRLRTRIGRVAELDDAVEALAAHTSGKVIIRVRA